MDLFFQDMIIKNRTPQYYLYQVIHSPIFLFFHFSTDFQRHWGIQSEDAGHADTSKEHGDAGLCFDCHRFHPAGYCSDSWGCGVVPASSKKATAQ